MRNAGIGGQRESQRAVVDSQCTERLKRCAGKRRIYEHHLDGDRADGIAFVPDGDVDFRTAREATTPMLDSSDSSPPWFEVASVVLPARGKLRHGKTDGREAEQRPDGDHRERNGHHRIANKENMERAEPDSSRGSMPGDSTGDGVGGNRQKSVQRGEDHHAEAHAIK